MNPRLLGDEMVRWSDLDGAHGPGPARGAALGPLLGAAHGRTLIAGPHDPALIDLAPADDLTLLVRGVADGRALAARYPEATVCVGGLAKFGTDSPFDTVIALAGLESLASAEGVEMSWGQSLDLLLDLLRPGGTLLLTVENHLGLHRLVALPARPDDADWTAAGEHDPSRPAGLRRVRDRLGRPAVAYAAYPDPLAPTCVLETGELDREDVTGALSALLTRAVEPLDTVLMDPRPLAARALRHGAAAELAPAWILAVGADVDLRRTLPSGRTLHDLLLGAALVRDLPAVRELLGTWLGGPAAGVPADQVVVGAAGDLTALAPAGDPGAALARFAADLIDGGRPHPWPAPLSPAELAVTLAAMTGREIEPPEPAGRRPGPAVRELLIARTRLAEELERARAKQLWYEQMLVDREAALKRLQRINLVLGATAPARALLSGARAARRTARRVLRPRG